MIVLIISTRLLGGGGNYPIHDSELRESILDQDGKVSQDALAVEIVSAGIDSTNNMLVLDGDDLVGLEGKVDKVLGATGNLAKFKSDGDIEDSGISAGNTSISSIGDGTISGAISAENSAIEAIVNVYGGKNLLCIKLSDVKQANTTYGMWNNDVWTMYGVTYTLDVDSSGYVKSITANGTSQYRSYIILPCTSFTKGKYKVNGYIGNSTDYEYGKCMYIASTNAGEILGYVTSLDGFEFEEPQATADILVFNIGQGNTVTNETCYPMIRDARISDSTYVPYTKTNKELTIETNSIAPILNVYGSKNLWDYTKFINGIGLSQNNGVYTNTLTDTRNYLHLVVNALNSSSTVISTLINDTVSSTGNKEYKRTIPNGTAYFEIKHNGLTQDFVMYQPVSVTGDFILSLNITGTDPTTVGGLSFTNVMLRDARISDHTYAPYAMTNRELTEKVITQQTQHIESFYISITENQSSWQPITPITTLQYYPVRDVAVMAFNMSNGQVMNIYVRGSDKTLYNLSSPLATGDWQVVVSYNSI